MKEPENQPIEVRSTGPVVFQVATVTAHHTKWTSTNTETPLAERLPYGGKLSGAALHPIDYSAMLEMLFVKYPDYSGGCLKYALLMYALYPESRLWYNHDTVVVQHGEYFLHFGFCLQGEISGDVLRVQSEEPGFKTDFLPLERFGERLLLRSFPDLPRLFAITLSEYMQKYDTKPS